MNKSRLSFKIANLSFQQHKDTQIPNVFLHHNISVGWLFESQIPHFSMHILQKSLVHIFLLLMLYCLNYIDSSGRHFWKTGDNAWNNMPWKSPAKINNRKYMTHRKCDLCYKYTWYYSKVDCFALQKSTHANCVQLKNKNSQTDLTRMCLSIMFDFKGKRTIN